MADFPKLIPNSISFDLGSLNISEAQTQSLVPKRFRHSLRTSNYTLNINYTGLSQAQIDGLRSHFYGQVGTHNYFGVPSEIWGGLTAVSPGAVYRYAAPPQEEHTGLYYNATVQLAVVIGEELLYILNGGGATAPATTAFTSFVFNGYAPFILEGGDADRINPSATLLLYGGGAG
ncbi:hypothetical protein EBT31_00705 [bacterium]|nr:hypothetical protein [bacterium]